MSVPLALSFPAADGYVLHGHVWAHAQPCASRPVVVVNPATAVLSRYYARFAAFLHRHGFDVVSYDYRQLYRAVIADNLSPEPTA